MESTQEIETKSAFLTTLHLALLSFLIALPVFSGFDLASSTRFGIFLTINVLCGQYVWSKLLINRNPSIFESLAAGLALGTSIPAVINISIRLIGLFGFSTGYIFPIACIFGWLVFDRKLPQLSASTNKRDDQDFRILLATPLLAIVAWNPHAWPFCAAYLAGALIVWFIESKNNFSFNKVRAALSTVLLFVFAAVLSRYYTSKFLDKPIWQLFLGTDTAWDEATAWSVSSLGIRENALFHGHPTRNHILTHAWAGDVAGAAKLPSFLVTGTTGFAVGILGISLAIYISATKLLKNRFIATAAAVIPIAQASMPEELMIVAAPRFANSISAFYLALTFLLFVNFRRIGLKHQYIIWASLVLVVTLSKFHWGVILIASLFFVSTSGTKDFKSLKVLTLASISFFMFAITYIIFIKGRASEKIELSFSISTALAVFLPLFFRSFALFGSNHRKIWKSVPELITFSVLFLTVVGVSITNGRNNTFYFFSVSLLVSALFVLPSILEQIKESVHRQKIIGLIALGLFFGISTSLINVFLRYRIAEVGRYKILHWLLVKNAHLIQPALILMAVITIYFAIINKSFLFKNRRASITKLNLCILLAIGINLGNWIVAPLKPNITRFWQDVNFGSEVAFSREQFDIANWIRMNTPEDSVIATNFSCSAVDLSSTQLAQDLDCLTRNTLTWIAPIAKREVLIESPIWFSLTPGSSQEREISTLIEFTDGAINDSDPKALDFLRSLNADYIVIDYRRTDMFSCNSFKNVLYKTSNFCIAKI